MDELILGKPDEWTAEIRAKWAKVVADMPDDRGPITRANYWHPTPYVDQYNRGRDTEGFTYTVAHINVWRVTLDPEEETPR